MRYVIESDFMHEEMRCVVVMQEMGHRCAYVGVPKGNKYFGKKYKDILENINCHGGLTFSSVPELDYPIPGCADFWFFGWDYAHAGDENDWETYETIFPQEIVENNPLAKLRKGGRVHHLDKVIEECKHVAEQMKG